MDVSFQKNESLAEGVQRILETQLVGALENLRLPPEKRDEGIHECRKQIKYARALLRLVRKGMPGKIFDKWNCTLRDAARVLSGLRDSVAVIESLDALIAELSVGEDARAELNISREFLRAKSKTQDEDSASGVETATETAFVLISGQMTTPHDSKLGHGREERVIASGLRRSYAAGQAAMKRIRKSREVDVVHEWRKRTKDLRYQIAMLVPVWPAWYGAMEQELHRLTDALGRIHDLDMLALALAELPEGMSVEVHDSIRRVLDITTAEALRIGRRLYGEKPEMFAERMAEWWKMWKKEINGHEQENDQ